MSDSDETSGDDPADFFKHLQGNMVQNARRIWDHEHAVHRLDPDHFDVISLRTPSRRVRVNRTGDVWRCRSDKDNTQDNPFAHILVLIDEGVAAWPDTSASVWTKTKQGRNHAARSPGFDQRTAAGTAAGARCRRRPRGWLAGPSRVRVFCRQSWFGLRSEET